jgi:hypothetical protein
VFEILPEKYWAEASPARPIDVPAFVALGLTVVVVFESLVPFI